MARRQLLIIHTDPPACKKLASPLIRSGAFSVEYACNPFDAAVELFTNDYDCLILHVDTPGLDAVNAIQRLRSSERNAQLPIIVLLNHEDPLTIRTLKAVGVNAFQTEPVSIHILISNLRRLTQLLKPIEPTTHLATKPELDESGEAKPKPVLNPYTDGEPVTDPKPQLQPESQPELVSVLESKSIEQDIRRQIIESSERTTRTVGAQMVDRIWLAIRTADPIPGIPAEVTRMDKIIGDLSGEQITKEIVGLDLNLVIGILRQVNSIDYRGMETITSLSRAMNRIGIREIYLRFNNTYQTRKTLPRHTRDFVLNGFARHNLMVACLAEELAGKMRGIDPDTAFSAGLLHDVGKLFLIHNFYDSYLLVRDADIGLWDDRGEFCDIAAVEREMLQVDHGVAGYELCRGWSLPPIIQAGTVHHEENANLRSAIHEPRITAIITLADLIDQIMDCQQRYQIYDLDQFFNEPDRELPPWLVKFVKNLRLPLRHVYDRARLRVERTFDKVSLRAAA